MPTHLRPKRSLAALTLLASFATLTAVGCRRSKPDPVTPPPASVAVVKPGVLKVQVYYEYNGYLEAVEVVQVQARVEGMLTDILFKEGDEVPKGKPLYTIDNREYLSGVAKSKSDIARAEADIGNAKIQIRITQAEYDRLKGLGKDVSKSELEKAESALVLNETQLKLATSNKGSAQASLATAELKLEYTDIRAEIAGRISRTRVTRGNLVGQKEPTLLTTIVSLDPLYVYFDVPERDFVEYQKSVAENTVQRPADGDLRVDVGVVNEEGYPHAGFIDFRDNRVETGTGTVRLRGRIPNPAVGSQKSRLLYPGLYSRVRIPRGEPTDMLVIPEDALMTGQEGQYVYVIGPENAVQKRTVKVGPQVWRQPQVNDPKSSGWSLAAPKDSATPAPTLRSLVSVEKSKEPGKGLSQGDSVIVVGLQKARPGAPVDPEMWTLVAPPPVPATR